MSCDTRRRRLWQTLGLDASVMESIFREAQKEAQGRDIVPEEREVWTYKTRRVLALFDQYGIQRPVHSKKSDLPRRSALAGYAAVWDALSREMSLPTAPYAGDIQGFDKQAMEDALTTLGRMALERGHEVELLAVGGTAMVMAYSARVSTKDVDVVVLWPG